MFVPKTQEGGANDAKALRLARVSRIYRIIRILRLLKLFRVLKLQQRGSLNKKVYKNVQWMIKTSFQVIYAINLMACIWYFVPSLNDFEDKNSWIWSANIIDETNGKKFLVSFYWSC